MFRSKLLAYHVPNSKWTLKFRLNLLLDTLGFATQKEQIKWIFDFSLDIIFFWNILTHDLLTLDVLKVAGVELLYTEHVVWIYRCDSQLSTKRAKLSIFRFETPVPMIVHEGLQPSTSGICVAFLSMEGFSDSMRGVFPWFLSTFEWTFHSWGHTFRKKRLKHRKPRMCLCHPISCQVGPSVMQGL